MDILFLQGFVPSLFLLSFLIGIGAFIVRKTLRMMVMSIMLIILFQALHVISYDTLLGNMCPVMKTLFSLAPITVFNQFMENMPFHNLLVSMEMFFKDFVCRAFYAVYDFIVLMFTFGWRTT